MQPIFITGTGTAIGKTIASVVVANALEADYWKPVQAGIDPGTDSGFVANMLAGSNSFVMPETYRLLLPASPHIAAREEGTIIELDKILEVFAKRQRTNAIVIEGAGGLLVPLNNKEMMIDLIIALKAKVILVSRNYLGSINHSLLTAAVCRERGVDVLGWLFNDEYMNYQDEIAGWTGYPIIGHIPKLPEISRASLAWQSALIREKLLKLLETGVHDQERTSAII